MIKISPSILSANFANLEKDIHLVESAGAHYLHVDVMDGHFVPNITIGAPVVASIRKVTRLPLDVHLMISDPDHYLDDFIRAGSDVITVHYESNGDTLAQIERIHAAGRRASVSIKPNTPADVLYPLLPVLDMVLIMTVEPGFGGQSLIPGTLDKVRALRREIDRGDYPCEIEIDGGATTDNAALIASAGADIIVAGSAIFGAHDPAFAVRQFLSAGL